MTTLMTRWGCRARRLIFAVAVPLAAFAQHSEMPQDNGNSPNDAIDIPKFTLAKDILPKDLNASYCNWLDVNNDAKPDLLAGGARLFVNTSHDGSCSFKEVTEKLGIKPAPALCFDIDNDGWTDIVNTRGQILHNNHDGSFTDIGPEMGFKPHEKALTLAAADLDANGFPDIIVGMAEDWNNGHPKYYPLQLWLNNGKTLSENAHDAGIDRATYARSILVNDVNGDDKPDIIVANYRLQPNLLWINNGNITFKDEGKIRGITGKYEPRKFYDHVLKRHFGYSYGHTIAAAWLDFDNDGHLDLWISNLVHKYVGATRGPKPSWDIRGYVCDDSPIYRNDNGFFTDVRTEMGIPLKPIGDRRVFKGDELWAGAAVADANNDGFQDVFVPQVYNLSYAKTRLFINDSGKAFFQAADEAGLDRIDTYCGAWADVNGDGLMDLATAGRPAVDEPHTFALFINMGSETIRKRPWLGVTLRSSNEGGTAIGALLTVTATFSDTRPALIQTRLNDAGNSSYGQQNDPELHVAFPDTPATITLHIRWPNGAVSTQTAQPKTHIIASAIPKQ